MKFWTSLLNLLYPPKCVFCQKLLRDTEVDLCSDCRTELPKVSYGFKRGECYEICEAVYFYEGAVADSVRRFKFAGCEQYASAYGRFLAKLILQKNIEFDVLTWVPISDKRAKKRGFRQTKLLAEATAKELGLKAVQTLKKHKDNPAQSSLHSFSDRKKNVKNVYTAVDAQRFCAKRVLLIDDVVTSGATLSECSRVLRKAGAKSIVCVCLAAVRD